MFPSTPVVNAILAGMPYGGISDMTKPAPASVIKAFQRDFNAVSTAMHSGKIAPSKQFANGATLRGTLSEDGIPGVNTLRALELARLVILTNDDKWAWPNFVAKAKA
ncbi:MAG: hypothetical protein A2V88_04375 [Elusimicrobia bacterium RBG_16_66_12]|nr:MAG: hypothetical protein A2V88_04375 [Elusimicrobia bacterium RBG_16_66_12]